MTDNRTPEQKQRAKDVILIVIAAFHELERHGLAKVNNLPKMTIEGHKRVQVLSAGGFNPTDSERRGAMIYLQQTFGCQAVDVDTLHKH